MDYPNPNFNPDHFLGVVHFRVVHFRVVHRGIGSPWTGGQGFVHHRSGNQVEKEKKNNCQTLAPFLFFLSLVLGCF